PGGGRIDAFQGSQEANQELALGLHGENRLTLGVA
ncbi:MAG: hypothetical protein QOI66_5251, partial [Myxococcales bacterium]|nr:hypothetical protein [Myxococcales bacterium]